VVLLLYCYFCITRLLDLILQQGTMTTKTELAKRLSIANPQDAVDIGYELYHIDQKECYLWTIDCAEHVLPICQNYSADTNSLLAALNAARDFINGKVEEEYLKQAAESVSKVSDSISITPPIRADLFEAIYAIGNAVKLAIPKSGLYFEDVIYSAARAVWYAGGCQINDLYPPQSNECEDFCEEEEGRCESLKERLWQLQLLQNRLLISKI
jgi:hypothetical protein